jgi:predicted RNA binding protein YcfA (HicA-like mRNA interferase family)
MPIYFTIKTALFIKFIESQGYEFTRSSGSHHYYSKEDVPELITVKPKDKDIKGSFVSTYVKQMGLESDVYFDFIGKKKPKKNQIETAKTEE